MAAPPGETLYEAWKTASTMVHTHPTFEENKNDLLLFFCRDGDVGGVKWIVERHGADPAFGYDKPLHIACRNGHYAVAEYLLKIPRVRKYAPANYNRSLLEAQRHEDAALVALLKSVPEIATAGPDMDKFSFGLRFDDKIAELPPFEPYVPPPPLPPPPTRRNRTLWEAIVRFVRRFHQ